MEIREERIGILLILIFLSLATILYFPFFEVEVLDEYLDLETGESEEEYYEEEMEEVEEPENDPNK